MQIDPLFHYYIYFRLVNEHITGGGSRAVMNILRQKPECEKEDFERTTKGATV